MDEMRPDLVMTVFLKTGCELWRLLNYTQIISANEKLFSLSFNHLTEGTPRSLQIFFELTIM